MTTTHIDLPRAIDARKGAHLRLVLDCVAGDEGLVVEEMDVSNALTDAPPKSDKSAAVATYVKKWGGTLASPAEKQAAIERMRSRWKGVGSLTDQEIDDLRYEAIMEKHGKGLNP